MNENKDRRYQNLWDTAKAILRGSCIGVKCLYQKRSQINNLTFYLKTLEKADQTKPKASNKIQ